MNKMRQNISTVIFSLVLGLVCSLLLSGAADFNRQRQTNNKKAEEIRNILTALKIPFDYKSGPQELIAIFERDVKEQILGEQDSLTLYTYKPQGSESISAAAVKFTGPGVWGPIKGFLALESDYKTIRGVTFYEQEETPGLGGEIATENFRGRFEGKQIADKQGVLGINIGASAATQTAENEIAGISGATMTCDKVEEMINIVIAKLASKRESYGR